MISRILDVSSLDNDLPVLSRSSVIPTDDEVGSSKVLPNNRVPKSLPGSSHPHSQRQQGQSSHTIRVSLDDCFVDSYSSESINISGLGKSNDGVDEDVGEVLTSSTDSQLSVSPVHGVSGLEGNDSSPGELVEVGTELVRGV